MWLNGKRKRKYVKQCMDQIGKLDKNTMERQIVRLYMEGKIDESQHDFLVDKINDNYK
jgi:hypothetical protein